MEGEGVWSTEEREAGRAGRAARRARRVAHAAPLTAWLDLNPRDAHRPNSLHQPRSRAGDGVGVEEQEVLVGGQSPEAGGADLLGTVARLQTSKSSYLG